jgi:hypothetical protein
MYALEMEVVERLRLPWLTRDDVSEALLALFALASGRGADEVRRRGVNDRNPIGDRINESR